MMKILILFCLLLKDAITKEVGDICSSVGDNLDGTCKMVADCTVALRLIKKTHQHPFSTCGFDGYDEIVCCPTESSSRTTEPSTPINRYEANRSPRIADMECEKIKSSSIPPLSLHIIGGEIADIGEFPHMVALGYKITGSDGYNFNCGGSLISDTFVITAAHCVNNIQRQRPSIVRAGVINIGGENFDDNTDFRIIDIIEYPERSGSNKYHDLALLRLERPIAVTMNLNAICLHTSKESPTKPLTVTGWGTISTTKDLRSPMLLKANVSVVQNSVCEKTYKNWLRLPKNVIDQQLCAGDPKGQRDACQGDSGGPLQGLLSNDGYYRLVGITSFGAGCGSPKPAVYTRIAAYLDWIESVVWPDS